MSGKRNRRSPRLAVILPIRVSGIDYQGMNFVEDGSSLVVNRHGAKIQLDRQLVPEQEIVIQSLKTKREVVFRVVGKAPQLEGEHSYWGVESLEADENLWGIEFPELAPADQRSVRVLLECPGCHQQESVFMDEARSAMVAATGGVQRSCKSCGQVGFWFLAPYGQA